MFYTNLSKLPLSEALSHYTQYGFSAFPLGVNSKKPLVAWSDYQFALPSARTLRAWQQTIGNNCNVAVVTGAVSRLLVIDFDAPEKLTYFRQDLPHLSKTYTVQTRRGFHLYFQLPVGFRPSTRHYSQVDLLGQGSYVVGPPSSVNGFFYTPTQLTDLVSLDADQYQALDRYFSHVANPTTVLAVSAPKVQPISEKSPVRLQVTATPAESAKPHRPGLESDADLVAFYRAKCSLLGRNSALFMAACAARDAGYTEMASSVLFITEHIHQPPPADHPNETADARHREALATIRSVYSRPSRRLVWWKSYRQRSYLSGAIREALLDRGLIAVARVWEAYQMFGGKAGDCVTRLSLIESLSGYVGEYTIRNALSSGWFPPPAPPSEISRHTPSGELHKRELRHSHLTPKNASVDTASTPTELGGRRCKIYQVPTEAELATKLGVTVQPASPMRPTDLQSPTRYRLALHRDLLTRAPGAYSRETLARRLGVSARTLNRYNQRLKVRIIARYREISPIEPAFAEQLQRFSQATGRSTPGVFLKDCKARAYPARLEIYNTLTKRGLSPQMMVRLTNFYSLANIPTPPVTVKEPAYPAPDQAAIKRYFDTIHKPPSAATLQLPPQPATMTLPKPSSRPTATPPKPASQLLKDAPRDQQYWAVKLYERVNQNMPLEKHMSLANAFGLVKDYGVKLVRKALWVLDHRDHITNPAGFVFMFIKSLYKKALREAANP